MHPDCTNGPFVRTYRTNGPLVQLSANGLPCVGPNDQAEDLGHQPAVPLRHAGALLGRGPGQIVRRHPQRRVDHRGPRELMIADRGRTRPRMAASGPRR
ncbi:hypothetical protein ACQP04_07695 [Pseudonocardia halophobica]|uniref:hypothetical protein n=1 Tax=Pseudonocardia halophobica TaxID=29401 RepID=UPI003D8A9897